MPAMPGWMDGWMVAGGDKSCLDFIYSALLLDGSLAAWLIVVSE